MSKPGSKDGSLVNTLSSFWRRQFKDEGHLEGIYKAVEILLGQVYREMLENAQALSLEATPVFGRDYWREIFLVEAELDIRISGAVTQWAFPLDDDIVSFKYLQDRVTTPTRIFEEGKDFTVQRVDGQPEIVFTSENPLETDSVPVAFITRDEETVLTGYDAHVEYGVPNEHLSTSTLVRRAEINARNDVRRTLTIDGIRFETRKAGFYQGRSTWIYIPNGQFVRDEVVGRTLRGYHSDGSALIAEDRTISALARPDVLVVDSEYDSAFAVGALLGEGQVQLIDPETFQPEHVGFTLELTDHENADNSGEYTIEAVNSGTEVLLTAALPFDSTTARVMTSVTRAGLVFSIPSAQTRVTAKYVGYWAFISDGSGNQKFFEIESLANPNASGFYQDVTVLDPDGVISSFDTTGLSVSIRVQEPSAFRMAWELKTPEITRRAQLFAPDITVDRRYLSERYGVLVEREQESSQAYKQFLQGVFQYFWVGPTHFAMKSALNTLAGFPVIESDGELLLRVVQSTTQDEVITDRRSYILPAGYTREELLETSAERTKVFRKLEPLTGAFIVEDLVSDPTWMFNLQLPVAVMPDEPPNRRFIDPRLRRTVVGGGWKVGDPGIFVGSGSDGVTREDDIIEMRDAFVSGTTVTTDTTKIVSTYAGKTVMIYGRSRLVTSVPTDQSFTIDSELEAELLAAFNPSADLDGDLITVASYEFTGDKDLGRPIVTSGGTFYVDNVVDTHIAQLVDSSGTPMAAAPTTETVEFGWTMDILNRAPLHASIGVVVAQTLSGPNTFGVRYELDENTLSVATLQDDIADLIIEGRPAHTFFLNYPFSILEDIVYVGDDDVDMTVVVGSGGGTEEFPGGSFTLLSRPLRVGAAWSVGDIFFLNHGYITWDKRISFAEMGSLPSDIVDGSGYPFHEVFDGRSATELFLDLEADNPGETYTIDIYFWNGAAWVFYDSVDFDTDNPQIENFLVGGLYFAFDVTASTGTEVVLRVGARRDSIAEKVSIANHPSGTGSISIGSDILTDASFDFFEVDVGRELFLAYDVSGTMVYEQVRVIARIGLHTVQLVNKTDNLAFSAPVTSSAVAWQFGAQKRWGQTSLMVGGLDPSLDPPSGAPSGTGYGVELPLQVAIID
jgi:hypothetical protein